MADTNIIRTYKLVQQTPMIHFQSEEEGATLRASEVKPKLDRFLLKQLGGVETVRGTHADWFVSSDHPALKYKVRFSAMGKPQADLPHKLYFGNMGVNKENERKTVYCPDGVSMTIICGVSGLRDQIDKFLPVFFIMHAFGTRSGKGFGCFSLKGRDVDPDLLLSCCPMHIYYCINYPGKKAVIEFLNDIWVISGMMKSGFNYTFRNPADYFKGHIFRYFSLKGNRIGGDKAFIKQKVLTGYDQNGNSEERSTYSDFRFIRAMLGLPGGFEYRAGNKTTRRGKVEVRSGSADVERFQSPVHYRVRDNVLYIIPQIIPIKMMNTEFLLNGQSIRTPEEFDLIDFLDSFCKRFNERKDIGAFQYPDIKNTLIANRNLVIRKIGGVTA